MLEMWPSDTLVMITYKQTKTTPSALLPLHCGQINTFGCVELLVTRSIICRMTKFVSLGRQAATAEVASRSATGFRQLLTDGGTLLLCAWVQPVQPVFASATNSGCDFYQWSVKLCVWRATDLDHFHIFPCLQNKGKSPFTPPWQWRRKIRPTCRSVRAVQWGLWEHSVISSRKTTSS
jgi:hypothetical protein